MRRPPALLVFLSMLFHVGAFVPKDDDVARNVKEIRFPAEARRPELAVKLFDEGIAHATMEKEEKRSGFATRARTHRPDLPPERRREQARKLINAAWRYYNLADFAVSAQDARTGVGLRMGFEDAQTYLGGLMVDPMWAASATAKPARPDEAKAAALMDGMILTLARFMADAARIARAGEARRFLPSR